ncbi:MAG: tyrosine-type recombinase/integrase [Acetobacter syzygii]|uniref:tyrosine-type recombinase/integrase n=1 Tax=Acetobacter syzygii TaxID=146476 RepID=UPI00242A6D1A|nr:tyrosine-type recombinase/integrase [Acetobacter syzygii]
MLRAIPSQRNGQPRYHFRRLVPVALRPLLGKTEISLVLHTSDKLVARERAALLYARTGQLFQAGKMKNPSKDDLIALYEKIIAEHEALRQVEKERNEAVRNAERARFLFEKMELVTRQTEFLNNVTPSMQKIVTGIQALRHKLDKQDAVTAADKKGLHDQIDNLNQLIMNCATKTANLAPNPPEKKKTKAPSLSEMAERFVYNDPSKSAGTTRDTGKTVALFIEAFGDCPVDQITGTVAGEFRDLLFGLPANHGKGKSTLPLRETVKQTAELGAATVSGKTVKNHFSRLSSIWTHLVQREIVMRNPWANWKFDTTKKIERRAWSESELTLLLRTPWTRKVISKRTYQGIVQTALYTGMRLGEICNLRNKDVEVIDGIPCFHIQPYTEIINGKQRDWSPKTAAGTRIVPIHSKLLEAGILSFKNAGLYFFDELTIASNGIRGSDFAQAFSKFKREMGIPEEVTFHSFRHLVSTKLRNQKSDIRELWIDALLGHEATHRSQGTTNYMSGIDVRNLQRVVEALTY